MLDRNDCLRGAEGDATFPLGPIDLGDSTDSCNPQWYARGLGDSGSTGSGYVWKGLPPSFPVI